MFLCNKSSLQELDIKFSYISNSMKIWLYHLYMQKVTRNTQKILTLQFIGKIPQEEDNK